MPLDTNLGASPYFDDFDQDKDYYRVLFKPATAVQVREVNQLQAILSYQAEQFGDHILKAGTIVDGCDFAFQSQMDYVKILDTTSSGTAVDLNKLNGLFLKGLTNKQRAIITHTEDGFESDGVNLKTLYIEYSDESDVTTENLTYTQSEILEVYATDDRVWDFQVAGGGNVAAFSNTDGIAVLSAIEVATVTGGANDWSNTFVAGETLTDSTGNIEVLLTDDDGTVDGQPAFYVETEEETAILRIKPKPAYQTGSAIDQDSWNIPDGTILTSATSGNEMKVVRSVGSGATATVLTTAAGQINDITLSTGGNGYTTPPHVSIYSLGASESQVSNLLINPQMYYQRLVIADNVNFTNPIGVGYGMSIQEGKIYQKGLFLNVRAQFKMVDKYSNTPDAVSVGFNSTESIVNVFTDSTLYDNAAGFLNESAPGADRLKLTPVLIVKTEAEEAETADYFPIVRFSEGRPFNQQKETAYNKIGDMLAQRTYEESGNYVLDDFQAITASALNMANTDTHFRAIVDPGHAYISGYRVETEQNFAKEIEKATDTINETASNFGTDANYGSYIRIKEVAGCHEFKTNQTIQFFESAQQFITNYNYGSANTVSAPAGTASGTARFRSLVHHSGVQGTSDAEYRMYIYDVQMNNGKSFDNVKSVYTPALSGNTDGVADLILEQAPNSVRRVAKGDSLPALSERVAKIYHPKSDAIVINTGRPAKAFTNYSYTYRSSLTDVYATTTGVIELNAEGGSETTFPYVSNLSDNEENDIILIPQGDVSFSTATYTGVSVTSNTTVVQITGSTPTADCLNDLRVGEWLTDAAGEVAQITSVINSSSFGIGSTSASGFGATSITRILPKDIPVPLDQRSGMFANVASDGQSIDIHLGANVSNTNPFTVMYDQKVTNSSSNLPVTRQTVVKLSDSGGWVGCFPKCLGVAGIIRLRAVYNSADTSGENITDEFYIDHNQNESYYGLGYLYRGTRQSGSATLNSTITVVFDHLTEATHGLKLINSYTINDETELASLTTNIHTLEIPQMHGESGAYYDLRECVDFRPFASNTAVLTTNHALATTNPSETVSFAAGNYRIPKPGSDIKFNMEFYIPRRDEIAVKADGTFDISTGHTDMQSRTNENRLPIYNMLVAPYPSLPSILHESVREIADTKVLNNVETNVRLDRYSNKLIRIDSGHTGGYTMAEIGNLERRLAALEYNQNLTELENSTTGRTIQSSVDGTLERFKFGFFVDNFENYNNSATEDPNYNASIYEYVLQPAKGSVSLNFKLSDQSRRYLNGDTVTFPQQRRRLISQTIATYAPFKEPEPEPEIKEVCEFFTNKNQKSVGDVVARYSILEEVWEEFTIVGADTTDGTARTIDIKFFSPAGGIAFEVIQTKKAPTSRRPETGTVVFSPISGTASSLTSSESVELYQKGYPVQRNRLARYTPGINPWFESLSSSNIDVSLSDSSNATYKGWRGAGKISFTYNYLNGRYITVRVHKKQPTFNFEVCYPAIEQKDVIYDQGSDTYNRPEPVCPKGQFKFNRCVGTTKVTYVCDGFGGTEVGRRQPNSPDCGYSTPVVTQPPVPDEPEPYRCPPSGTPAGDKCSGTTEYVYQYTGRFIGGTSYASLADCAKMVVSVNRNATDCGYTPPVQDPDCDDETDGTTTGYGTVPQGPNANGDDGCVPNVDPHCPIETGSNNTTGNQGDNNNSTPPTTTTPPNTGGNSGYGGGTTTYNVNGPGIGITLPNNLPFNTPIVLPDLTPFFPSVPPTTIRPPISGYGSTPPFTPPPVVPPVTPPQFPNTNRPRGRGNAAGFRRR